VNEGTVGETAGRMGVGTANGDAVDASRTASFDHFAR